MEPRDAAGVVTARLKPEQHTASIRSANSYSLFEVRRRRRSSKNLIGARKHSSNADLRGVGELSAHPGTRSAGQRDSGIRRGNRTSYSGAQLATGGAAASRLASPATLDTPLYAPENGHVCIPRAPSQCRHAAHAVAAQVALRLPRLLVRLVLIADRYPPRRPGHPLGRKESQPRAAAARVRHPGGHAPAGGLCL